MHYSNNSIFTNTLNDESDWPRFREHSLYEAAVEEAAREVQVSREMAMMCAFGAMATACQGYVDVQMPTGRQVPASLMLLTIADSGERKTTTLNDFFEAIQELNNSEYLTHVNALKEHRAKHLMWSAQKRHLESQYRKSASKKNIEVIKEAEEVLASHLKDEPFPAISGKFLYEDTTPQALVQMLYENTSNACLLTSEANSILSGKALGELDKLNTLWDGGSVIVDRISREGFILQNARLTLSLMAQPTVIHRFMGKRGEEARGTGFLARFLVARPRSMAGLREARKFSDRPRKKAFNDRIREILNIKPPSKRQTLRFSEHAVSLWHEYSKYLEESMQENGLYYYLRDHASKILENTSRLAAILHTFERKSDDDAEIGLDTLEYCWKFTQKCSSDFIKNVCTEPQVVTDANEIARFLLREAWRPRGSSIKRNKTKDRHESTSRNFLLSPIKLPNHLRYGYEFNFSLTELKQYGPSSLEAERAPNA